MRRTLILAGLVAGIVALSAWTPVGRSELEAAPPSVEITNVTLADNGDGCVVTVTWSESPRGKPLFVQMSFMEEENPFHIFLGSFQEQEKAGQFSHNFGPLENGSTQETLNVTLRDNQGNAIAAPMTTGLSDFCP